MPASRRLRWVRAIVLVLALLTAGQYVLGVPLYYRGLVAGCLHTGCEYALLVTPSAAEVAATGLSVPAYSLLLILIEVVNSAVFFAVAAVLFWRAPHNPVALLGAVCLFGMGATYTSALDALVAAAPIFWLPAALLAAVATICLFAFFSVFPNGRFVPRLMRYPLVAFAIIVLVLELAPSDAPMSNNLYLLLASVVVLSLFILSPALAQVYRYRRVSTPAEREQTKWVVFGVTAALVLILAVTMVNAVAAPRAAGWWGLLFHLIYYGAGMLIPLALLGAILLSRLWSIDVIIRRTLVYTLLTAALAGLYLAVVVVLQAVVGAVTGERRSTLVTVLSTLAIAAVFSPLRGWLQDAVDRRFYRSRYSVGQTLAAFSATVREDVDLDVLVSRLVGVVDETMQPAHVSLWLRPAREGEDTAALNPPQ